MRPINRQITRRIARAFLLLVAQVVFFVHHDQPQMRNRCQDCHARSQHNARLPGVRSQPALQALRRCHATVQRHDALLGKACGKALLQLGGEVDFRHQHQHLRLRVVRQRLRHRLQIHLGFAAAGCTKQQQRSGACVARCGLHRGNGLLLLLSQYSWLIKRRCGWVCGVCSRLIRCVCFLLSHIFFGQRLQTARQLHLIQFTQLRRQGRQCHFAQTALVVARGKGHQLPPCGVQRGHIVPGLQNGFGLHACRRGLCVRPTVPHHAQHAALPQRHAHQGAGRQPFVVRVVQRCGRQRAVRGQGHQYQQAMGASIRMSARISSRCGRPWCFGRSRFCSLMLGCVHGCTSTLSRRAIGSSMGNPCAYLNGTRAARMQLSFYARGSLPRPIA